MKQPAFSVRRFGELFRVWKHTTLADRWASNLVHHTEEAAAIEMAEWEQFLKEQGNAAR